MCIDIGASIGGFTDCLIKHGALKVYAIDTATDLLHPSLTCEKMKGKVIPLLGVDARTLESLDENVDFCTIDVTFASLKEILPNIRKFIKNNGEIIALVKPLFETEFHDEDKFNVIKDPERLQEILIDLLEWSIQNYLFPYNIMKSPLIGKGGSIEFFIYYKINELSSKFEIETNIKDLFKK